MGISDAKPARMTCAVLHFSAIALKLKNGFCKVDQEHDTDYGRDEHHRNCHFGLPLFQQWIAVETIAIAARFVSQSICRREQHCEKHRHRKKKNCHNRDPFSQITVAFEKSSALYFGAGGCARRFSECGFFLVQVRRAGCFLWNRGAAVCRSLAIARGP
ncbi:MULTISPECIES: hypothetical protein [unclassified Rhizobium]|uniref:hypothetical protein n=1 Tax=unclassified Rhizobium TaxID=2613769 RepID=UPI0012E21E33|nr:MULTISPECIES: hypothetical protein [unclassified Rhizobium]